MEKDASKKFIVWGICVSFFLLGGFAIYQSIAFSDKKLHINFCNVGQGDGVHIRTPNGTDILIDAGPDESLTSCLADGMPFWDKKVELAFLTHPHADHLVGFIDVLRRYSLEVFATEKLVNTTAAFSVLTQELAIKKIVPKYLHQGDTYKTADGVAITVLSPTKSLLSRTSPNGVIGEKQEFASLILLLSYGSFHVLFTGDSQVESLAEAISGRQSPVAVLQVPHHGSKTGLDRSVVDRIDPKLAVISVGKNRYGHPAEEVMTMLKEKNIKILRTDQNGSIKFISDGERYWVK